MPTYDYRCEANQKVYEVHHPMALSISNWGELRAAAGLSADDAIDDSTPVKKLMTAAGLVSPNALKNPEPPACASGGCAGNCV